MFELDLKPFHFRNLHRTNRNYTWTPPTPTNFLTQQSNHPPPSCSANEAGVVDHLFRCSKTLWRLELECSTGDVMVGSHLLLPGHSTSLQHDDVLDMRLMVHQKIMKSYRLEGDRLQVTVCSDRRRWVRQSFNNPDFLFEKSITSS